MKKQKPNRKKTASRSNGGKIKALSSASRVTARKTAKRKAITKATVALKPQSASQQTGRAENKQARIIAMLRTPGGVTIDAIAHAVGWQQHSVRGFLAGIVRKKLGLTLVSVAGEKGRLYRITGRPASAAA